MSWFQALVIGIVQGLTEFLPISSTAHVRLVPEFLGWPDPGAAFTAVIQLGTLLAVFVYFWKDILRVTKAWISGMRDVNARGSDYRLGWAVVYGTIPVVVLGFLFKDSIGGEFRSLYVIAGALIGLALLLGLAEKLAKHVRPLDDVTIKDGWVIGVFQALALVPGVSRSGSTITGALFLGFDRETAARLSFLLSIPAIFLAGIFELISEREALAGLGLMPVLVASIAAFVSGYVSIEFLLRFLRTRSTFVFIAYRVALGLLLFVLLGQGVLSAT
ncbi:MAG: undecaprenyl-diphosphate phosphatase [Armatimonadota bacterium]|nr:undecaprenyl-diphosphate phosphatase [Armatimonadota bacterium]